MTRTSFAGRREEPAFGWRLGDAGALDPNGCAGASVNPTLALRFGGGTFSIGYTCHGQGYFFQYGVGLGKHFQLPINGGDTVQVAALGSWFRVVSTTANMLRSGTTSGHQIYMLNLFKLPVTPLD